jgi:hypothetical protein
MTRRDLCYLAGKRASKLTPAQAAKAWEHLSVALEALGERDLPKFRDVIQAVRLSAIVGKTDTAEERPWTIEDPRMLREQIRIADAAYNRLFAECEALKQTVHEEDWRAQQDAFNQLQDEYSAFRAAALKVTTEKTIEYLREG